jgi:hypothetical protein
MLKAITGSATTEIGGRTSASVFGYLQKQDYPTTQDIKFFEDTRISVIDKFAGYHVVLGGISKKLKSFYGMLQIHTWKTWNLFPGRLLPTGSQHRWRSNV